MALLNFYIFVRNPLDDSTTKLTTQNKAEYHLN